MYISNLKKSLFAVFSLSLLFSSQSFAEKLTLACSPWYPFSGAQLEKQGFYNEIVKEAGAAAGLEIDIEIMPWKRLMVLTKEGKLDGIACPSYKKERESWLAFPQSDFFVVEGGFFARKDSEIKGTDIADLKGRPIGVMANSAGAKAVAEHGHGELTLKEYFDEKGALRMLHGKRFDAIYMVRVTGEKLLADKFPKMAPDIEFVGSINSFPFRPAISLKHPKARELADKLEAGYQAIQENGKLDEIMAKVPHLD